MTAFVTNALADIASHASQIITIVISGGLSLSGALLGVLIANKNNRRLKEEDRAHENVTRFHDLRMETYIKFLGGLDGFAGAVMAACSTHSRPERIQRLNSAMNALSDPYAAIRIVASEEVCDAAQSCMVNAAERQLLLLKGEDDDSEFRRLDGDASKSYLRLRDVMRTELGVTPYASVRE